MRITGWKLDPAQRPALLQRFAPAWPDVIADHVTLDASGDRAAHHVDAAHIVGTVDDGRGLQALVVEINGTTDRPDGSIYHLTWSLDRSRGRTPVESNAVIAERGWRSLDEPVPVTLQPARWP